MRAMNTLIAIILALSFRTGLAAGSEPDMTALTPALVLDFEILGETSVEAISSNDKQLIEKYSHVLRQALHEKKLFNVAANEQTLNDMQQLSQEQYLHRCNGCELKLAAEHDATLVVVPWISRMSVLISYMVVEIREVVTGEVVLRKSYNFRGNNEAAWQNAIDFFTRDLERILTPQSDARQ